MIESILSFVKAFFNRYILARSPPTTNEAGESEAVPLEIMLGPATFQILSDLHLESHPSYEDFEFEVTATNLALLGDIGHVVDDGFFTFLERQMLRYKRVFFLLGNHEPYQITWKEAKWKVREFEIRMNEKHSNSRFIFLDQTRYDLTDNITILGCTLFSLIYPDQVEHVQMRISDFKDIPQWTVADHNSAFYSDIRWLNVTVQRMAIHEKHRRVIVFTHHSPTVDPRSIDPGNPSSETSNAHATDCRWEPCWYSRSVVGWAFGHTHFNSCFVIDPTDDEISEDEEDDSEDERMPRDQTSKKFIVTNQKGYMLSPLKGFDPERVFTFGSLD